MWHERSRTLSGAVVAVCCLAVCADSPRLPSLSWDTAPSSTPYRYRWSDPRSEYLTRLRVTYDLDAVVARSTTDLERVQAICNWAHKLFRHDGNNVPAQGDPISIIGLAQQGQRFRCVEYSIVIAGCLKSLSIPARVLGLKTKDVETRGSGAGHVVAEAYLRDEGRWVMVDGQFDAIPVLAGRALSAIEFQQALAQDSGPTVLSLSQPDESSYFGWVGEYLYYFDTQLDQRGPGVSTDPASLMLVPLGAPEPHVFQGTSAIRNMSYTHSLADFYPTPEF